MNVNLDASTEQNKMQEVSAKHIYKMGMNDKGYWEVCVRFKAGKIRRGCRDYNYLAGLRDSLLKLRSEGGSYEDAKALLAGYPAPPEPPPRVPRKYKYDTAYERPMLYIGRRQDYKPNVLQPDGAPCWQMIIPWDGKYVAMLCHDLEYLQRLRDSLLELRTANGSYEDAKKFMKEYPKPVKRKRIVIPNKPKEEPKPKKLPLLSKYANEHEIEFYKAMRNKLQQREMEYRAFTQDDFMQYKADYYSDNHNKLLKRESKLFAANFDDIIKIGIERYINGRDRIIQNESNYYAENRDKILRRRAEYHEKKLNKPFDRDYPYVYIGKTRRNDIVSIYLKHKSKQYKVNTLVQFGTDNQKRILGVRSADTNFSREYQLYFDEWLLLSQQFKEIRMEYRDGAYYQAENYVLSNGIYTLAE
jgi:hypothetical protein